MHDSKLITHIDEQGLATVTLNRPEVHNAFDNVMIKGLHQILDDFDSNPKIRVVILAANGKSFSAGADLKHMQQAVHFSLKKNMADALDLAELFHDLAQLTKPTICLIQGGAIGGGVGLVAACDIAIASRNAYFQLSEVKLGLVPAVVSPYVIAAIGPRSARRYFLTGERFDAHEAQRLGLIHEVTKASKLKAAADKICSLLLQNGPKAMAAVKELIHHVYNSPQNNTLISDTAKQIAAIRVTAEGQEGVKAFFEKRKPNWR